MLLCVWLSAEPEGTCLRTGPKLRRARERRSAVPQGLPIGPRQSATSRCHPAWRATLEGVEMLLIVLQSWSEIAVVRVSFAVHRGR